MCTSISNAITKNLLVYSTDDSSSSSSSNHKIFTKTIEWFESKMCPVCRDDSTILKDNHKNSIICRTCCNVICMPCARGMLGSQNGSYFEQIKCVSKVTLLCSCQVLGCNLILCSSFLPSFFPSFLPSHHVVK